MLRSLVIAAALGFALASSGAMAQSAEFELLSVSAEPMTPENLCSQLDGEGAAPVVTITHSPVGGVEMLVHMVDQLSNGGTYDHDSTTVQSDASGTTEVNYDFVPACNRTGGRIDSSYRFQVTAGDQTIETVWGNFDSEKLLILEP